MPLEMGELEGCVEALYELARCEPDDVRWPSKLALRLFGTGSVVRLTNAVVPARLGRASDGRVWIGVRRGLPAAREQHLIGHELGHWILEREGYPRDADDIEQACDFIGAAVMTRRRVFASVATGHERSFEQLAFDFGTSETMVALRLGEVLGTPIAVITPQMVRARGGEWPDEQRLRELARRGAPGLSRVRLTDDRRRVALVGEEAAA